MKTLTRSVLILTALATLAFAPAGRAADPKPSAEIITAASTLEHPRPVTINVDFPGGSVSRLIEAIAKTEGVSLSIIAGNDTTDFARIELPSFTLRNVRLITVVEVMRELLQLRGYDFRPIGGSDDNTFVCMIVRIETPNRAPRTLPTEFMSFQLAPYLQQQSVDDIVGAIRAGWELDPAHDRDALKLKFHPGTSVLLVAGPAEALNLAQSIIRNLKHSTPEPVRIPAPGEPEKK